MEWFFIAFFLGGASYTYRLNRASGRSWFGSAMEAACWPWNVGYRVARQLYQIDPPHP